MFIEILPSLFLDSIWSHMFELDDTVFLTEKILRPVIVYAALILLLRLFGKRELGQLNQFDLVVILSVSNTVQNAIIGQDNSLIGGIIGAVALLGANYSVALLKFKNRKFEMIVEGDPRTIIENSKINQDAVRSELLTEEDLDTIAHRGGFESAKDLEKCIIDANGSFLVEGNTRIADENFRREVLKKLEDLSIQMEKLRGAV